MILEHGWFESNATDKLFKVMDKFTKMLQAKMLLMEGKEFRFGLNYPGTDKVAMLKEAIKKLEEQVKQMEEHPEEYKEKDENPRFQLSIELVKVNEDPMSMFG